MLMLSLKRALTTAISGFPPPDVGAFTTADSFGEKSRMRGSLTTS